MNKPNISKNNGIARRRYNLWKKHPYCHWCGKKLRWKKTTLDHINQKTKLMNGERRPYIGYTVLSCGKCNNQRQIDAFNELTKIQQWLKCGRVPRLRRAWTFKRKTSLLARLWLVYYHLFSYSS